MAQQAQLQGGGAGRAQKPGNGATVWSHFCLADEVLTSVQSLSHVQLFVTPWTAACQASLFFTISQSPPTHVHQVGDAIQPSHPLLSPDPPAISLSQHQGVFQ